MLNSYFQRWSSAERQPAFRKPASAMILSLLLAGGLAACDAASHALLAPGETAFLVQSGKRSVDIKTDVSAPIAAGETVQLEVRVTNGSGKVMESPDVTWGSDKPEVATVDANGLLTAVGEGTATISAAAVGLTDTVTVEVSGESSPTVATVTVTPASHSLLVGGAVQLSAAAQDAGGNSLERTFTWTSTAPAIATVSSSGLVTAISAGPVEIKAETDGVVGTSAITVSEAPIASQPPPPGQYSPTSPHYSHIRLEVTDFRIHHRPSGERSAEYDWTAAHYDRIMGGNAAEHRRRNPSIKHAPYTMHTTIKKGKITVGAIEGTEYLDDMQKWYAANPQYNLEDAFLHEAGATEKSEATRIVRTGWQNSEDWRMNVGDAGFRAYTLDRYRRLLVQHGVESDAIFHDSHETNHMRQNCPSAEYATCDIYYAEVESILTYLRSNLPGKLIHLNISGYAGGWIDKWSQAGGSVHMEFTNGATALHESYWTKIDRHTSWGVVSQMLSNYTWNDYNRWLTPGNEASGGRRGKLYELTSYYMARPTSPSQIDMVYFTPTNFWGRPFSDSTQWTPAIEVDIGQPRGARFAYAEGGLASKPACYTGSNLSWRVWAREYDRALVLARPSLHYTQKECGTDETAVTITLPAGTWYMVGWDGMVAGNAITTITLRNGEGAILIKGDAL